MHNGVFISFEGPDGSGKSTLVQKFYDYLLNHSSNGVIYTREPGGSDVSISEEIRTILLNNKNKNIDPITEALLFAASRSQHVSELIIPALEQNKIVICDRYVHSSLAYQGYSRGIGMQHIYDINMVATKGIIPDITFYIDLDVETALKRIESSGRQTDRMDQESNKFHQLVRDGYKKSLMMFNNKVIILDGKQSVESLLDQVIINFNQYQSNKR